MLKCSIVHISFVQQPKYNKLEIKTYSHGSRIPDMALWDEPSIELPKCALAIAFLASNRLQTIEVKNNYAHVTTACVQRMVWSFQHGLPVKILISLAILKSILVKVPSDKIANNSQ